jgi:hypothetical protein
MGERSSFRDAPGRTAAVGGEGWLMKSVAGCVSPVGRVFAAGGAVA